MTGGPVPPQPHPHGLRFPSIDGLRAFEAAARLGSFERAAEELAVTASAVSKRVATLEDLLGTLLLNRGPKALVLTAPGKEYLPQVRAALQLLATVPLHQRRGPRQQRLRVTTPPTFARQVLVPGLDAFCAAHPDIELEVLLSIPYLDGSPHDSDIEVRVGDVEQLAGAQVLLADRVVAVAAPALIARLPPLRTPADLAGAPLLRTPLEPWTPWLRAAGLPWPEPTTGPKLVDLGLTLEAAVCGQGLTLARPTLARHWLDAGTLRPLFPHITVPATQDYLLLPRAGSLNQDAAERFARWLQGRCAALSAHASAWLSGLA